MNKKPYLSETNKNIAPYFIAWIIIPRRSGAESSV